HRHHRRRPRARQSRHSPSSDRPHPGHIPIQRLPMPGTSTMTTPRPLSTAIRNEVLAACRTALHYRGDLKSLMLGAGVPAAVYNRYDHLENTKVKIARSILDELQELGPNGWAVQRRIVTELCGMQRPANG